VDINNKWLPKL